MRIINKCFTETEMRSLLSATRRCASRGTIIDKADHALVVFAYATGCRVGEIASMSLNRTEPNHFEVDAGCVSITEAKHGSAGVVPIDVASLRVLRRYVREVHPKLRNSMQLDRLFLTKTGRPYSPNVLTQKLTLLLRRFGFSGRTAHAFRHYYVTDLLRRGVQPHVVQALARHRDARTTLNVYAHPAPDDLRAAVNRRVG